MAPLESSEIRVANHAESEIVPECPLVAAAVAFVNFIVPKSVSGSTLVPPGVSAEGASAIHSAEETSGADIVSFFVNPASVVRLVSFSVTVVPFTLTDAEILSPAETFSDVRTDAFGTSSYQAEYRTRPFGRQSASVPVCSSAFEEVVSPPSPTQNADAVVDDVAVVQSAAG
jgi:hypothetical protein